MKTLIKLFLLLCLLPTCLFSQTNVFKFEKAASFFPDQENINQENIEWGYLIVPENWEKTNGKTIKVGVAILKSTSKNTTSNPILYIDGGPGAGGIGGIWGWLKNPLRQNNDIVLIDVRGTGFSYPKFCPDLGKRFLEILSKNQNSTQDEEQKIIAAMACKQDLINRDINIEAYNSKSIAKDLNALKSLLKYKEWNVYGASYGTYMAQVYANDFPEDIKSLILDSSIPDISKNYYNNNTSNYMNGLEKVFEACKNDPYCNKQYPDLERIYYATIKKIEKKPITVKVDKKIVPSGFFTYNLEDFKVCIQQSLYEKRLIEVTPLLITEFHKENEKTLSHLVAAFSGALSLDYGTFYCVTCNEAFPYNSISEFDKDVAKYKNLKGGLSFYRSDFKVCDKWNLGTNKRNGSPNDLTNLSALTKPVLVFSGGFDPITPPINGKVMVSKFKNGILINAQGFGHGPSFSKVGLTIVDKFINNHNQKINGNGFLPYEKINFITDIKINGGVASFANSLNELNLFFFLPLFIAALILLIFIFNFTYTLFKNKSDIIQNKLFKIVILITSLLGLFVIAGLIFAINITAKSNFYILVFGLPNQFEYLFIIMWIFVALTLILPFYLVFKKRSISNINIIITILFSFILIGVYFQYWGFLF